MNDCDLDDLLARAGLIPIEDAVRQDAYDAVAPERRGWLKATLALQEFAHGVAGQTRSCLTRPDLGYTLRRASRPADWTLCLIGPGFAAAPRLAAALMTARLAGQETLVAVFTEAFPASASHPDPEPGLDARPPSPQEPPADLLTVLDLTGIERAGLAASGREEDVIHGVALSLSGAFGPHGRVLNFGSAAGLPQPSWQDAAPALIVDSGMPGASGSVDEAVIGWAQPDAVRLSGPAADPNGRLLVYYGMDPGELRPGLHLAPGLEGCWLHPGLRPDFFMVETTALSPA